MRKQAWAYILSGIIAAISLVLVVAVAAAPLDGGTTSTLPCAPAWQIVASPNSGNSSNSLTAVAAVASNDVWAVGSYNDTILNASRTLIEHWNGSAWTIVASPNANNSNNTLAGVTVVNAGELWAVGAYYNPTSSSLQTLIEHYTDPCVTPTATSTVTPTNTATTATATATCSPQGNYRIMIAYSDSVPPNNLRNQLLSEPGIVAVDFFNARNNTPTLAQMQQYQIVLTFSNANYANSASLGNNLADYQDAGGITIVTTYAFVSDAPTFSIQGRWLSGGYSPFNYGPNNFADGTLGSHDRNHPLMQGVTTLSAYNRATLTLASGAIKVASWSDHDPLLATKGRAIGISAYLGDNPTNAGGQFSRVIANAARWLAPPPCAPTPTGTTPLATSTTTSTNTPIAPTATRTIVTTSTVIASSTPLITNTVLPTIMGTTTRIATGTSTSVVAPTSTRTMIISTSTSTNFALTSTTTATSTIIEQTPVPTVCPIQFIDVPPDSTFYTYVRCLACRGVANGYPCGGPGEPCNANNDGYFRPFANITRGQIAKMVSIAAGFGEEPGPQIYTDVLSTQTFYPYINRLTNRGYMGGYACGGSGEPCDAQNRPYFRPGANATRGQVSKIVANAAGINDPIPPDRQTYTDVPPSNPFWLYIERLALHEVISGYQCGGPGEPCDPQNRGYFRPFATITRGQTAKIVANTFFPNCVTPQKKTK